MELKKNTGKIVIVDYGMGNLFSVKKRMDILHDKVIISADAEEIRNADKLILPGVGHFGKAMDNLHKLGLVDVLNEVVLNNKKPVLGICLGMQIMAGKSEEGNTNGLGWIDAEIIRFRVEDKLKFKIPHTGWNQITHKKESSLNADVKDGSEFYFVHAYHIVLNNPADALHETDYSYPYISAVEKENIIGVQYHPEKSHDVGEVMLKNFVEKY